MSSESALVMMIKKQMKIEKQMEKELMEQEKSVHNAAAKLLLLEVRHDAAKHAEMLKELLKQIERAPNTLLWNFKIDSYVDSEVVRRKLEEHVKIEADVLHELHEQIKREKDEGIRLLLQHIADDEDKHHKILDQIVKKSYTVVK